MPPHLAQISVHMLKSYITVGLPLAYCMSRRRVLDDGVTPSYKSSVCQHADISTPLRNIQLLNVDDIIDDIALYLHIPLIVQQHLSNCDSDTPDQPHAGQPTCSVPGRWPRLCTTVRRVQPSDAPMPPPSSDIVVVCD